MANFTWVPDAPTQIQNKFNVNFVQFGDGYIQRSANGINSLNSKLSLQFQKRTVEEINDIENFLISTGGTANFAVTLASGVVIKVIIDNESGWTRQDMEANLSGISVDVIRVYEL